MAHPPVVPSFVSHLNRVSEDRTYVLDFKRNFFVIRHKHNRRRFRKSAVKQALEHCICYLGTVPAEYFPELDKFDTDSDTDGDITDSEFDPEDDHEEFDIDAYDEDSGLTEQEWLERKFESIRHNIYKLGPYLATDLKSWRVKLLLAPMPLRSFCERRDLPFAVVRKWMRVGRISSDASQVPDYIGFGWFDSTGKPDPFWVLPPDALSSSSSASSYSAASSSSSSSSSNPSQSQWLLTRAAQRFLLDFSAAHRAYLDTMVDYKIGDGADDDEDGSGVAIDEDTFVDATHERRRVQAAVWCQEQLAGWYARHHRHLHNPIELDGFYKDANVPVVSSKKAERAKYIEHLGKKLQHKKGKGKATKAGGGKISAAKSRRKGDDSDDDVEDFSSRYDDDDRLMEECECE